MNIFFLVSAVCATQVNFETFDPEYIGEFSKGFFSGVTNGNTKCTSSAGNMANSFYILVEDLKNYNNNYVQVLTDFSTALRGFNSIQVDCNIPSLILQIHKIMGPAGKAIIMRNYMMNSKQISIDLANIQKCADDFYTCGNSAGELFRIVTGYNPKLSATNDEETNNNGKDLVQLIQGFVSTAEFGITENCFKIFEQFKDFSKVKNDLLKVLESPVEDQVNVAQLILGVWMQDEDALDCGLQFGGMAFYAVPYMLSSPENWQRAYEFEAENVNHLFNQLTTVCQKDYFECGSKMGTLFNTIAAYA